MSLIMEVFYIHISPILNTDTFFIMPVKVIFDCEIHEICANTKCKHFMWWKRRMGAI